MVIDHPFCVLAFFLLLGTGSYAQFTWSNQSEHLYRAILSGQNQLELKVDEGAQGYLPYLKSLKIVVDHFLRSDNENSLEKLSDELDVLEGFEGHSESHSFCLGEVHFYLGFVHLSNGNKLKALYHFRQSYQLHHGLIKKNQGFIPSYKTRGVLRVMFGEAQYYSSFSKWLTGVDTTPQQGFKDLQLVLDDEGLFAHEAQLLRLIMLQFVCYDFEGATSVAGSLAMKSGTILDYGLLAIVYHKNNNAKRSNFFLNKVDVVNPYFDFLEGVNYCYLNEVKLAHAKFDVFLRQKWEAFCLSTRYYEAVLSKISGDEVVMAAMIREARVLEPVMPLDKNKKVLLDDLASKPFFLLKAHLYFDGGDWEHVLSELSGKIFEGRDRLEQDYLLAKTYDVLGQKKRAIHYYKNVVENLTTASYYKPYSCFYLAKIAIEDEAFLTANHWLNKAKSFKKYPHQQMIEVQLKKMEDGIAK